MNWRNLGSSGMQKYEEDDWAQGQVIKKKLECWDLELISDMSSCTCSYFIFFQLMLTSHVTTIVKGASQATSH